MKFLYALLFISLISKPNNCTCAYNIQKGFTESEVVFKAKVIDVSKLKNGEHSQKAKLSITKIYKGVPKTTIFSVLGGCSTPRPSLNTEWVFFATTENDFQVLNSCNPSFRLEPKEFIRKKPERLKIWKNQLEKKLKLLDTLSKKSPSN